MASDAWLPVGYILPDGAEARIALFEGVNWQILSTKGNGRALLVHDQLARRWIDAGLMESGIFLSFDFGQQRLWALSSGSTQEIRPVVEGRPPRTKADALSFALAMKATRDIEPEAPLQDALYVERVSRLLPTYGISSVTDDEVVLGYYLTGGLTISTRSFRRLHQVMSWLDAVSLKQVVQAAGFEVAELVPPDRGRSSAHRAQNVAEEPIRPEKPYVDDNTTEATFELAGRPDLAAFFNEHIIDIVLNSDRYTALGIDFPSAVVLHGPPGCGKTFAVERLTDFLGWPIFQVDASSVASPYIHETSKKVAEVFDKAMDNAPSVLVIDEMEAFLADRGMGSGHHRVEEVAEFLRRIPEATKNGVLIIAMTNRIDMIDAAILRRGRFDHVVKVDYASETEVLSLLEDLLLTLPKEQDVDPRPLARRLVGRPLSDVAFVAREGARLAARSGKDKVDQASLLKAMDAASVRGSEDDVASPRIGFI